MEALCHQGEQQAILLDRNYRNIERARVADEDGGYHYEYRIFVPNITNDNQYNDSYESQGGYIVADSPYALSLKVRGSYIR